jgi:hypothetical protein
MIPSNKKKLLPSFVLLLNSSFHHAKKCPKSSWQYLNFSVMFTAENEIIRRSWRQIYSQIFGLTQNILGPVEGQGISKLILFFRYDRQLRLWGDHGQVALEKARVCMIGATATATEILKSLGQARNMFSRIFRLRHYESFTPNIM